MAGVDRSEFECPVCSDLFKTPKLLPCYHLICRDCVLSWLQKTDGQGECPICRASILPAIKSCESLDPLEAQVDRLPTDLATQALAESHKILNGPHLCDMCPNGEVGQDFCLQCSIKLCSSCAAYHEKLPGTRDHSVQPISALTVSQLAARLQIKCKTHPQHLADMYCTSHAELLCRRCAASSDHRGCPVEREIEDVASDQRRKLKDRLEKLKQKDGVLAEKVEAVREHSEAMRQKAERVFDDLSQSTEKRRRDVINFIQAQEDEMVAQLNVVEKVRSSTALPRRNIENLVSHSPDDSLLAMRQQLVLRLDKLETQLKVRDVTEMGCLVLDDRIITRLKADLDKLGHLERPTSTPAEAVERTPTIHDIVLSRKYLGAGMTQRLILAGHFDQPTSTPVVIKIPPAE